MSTVDEQARFAAVIRGNEGDLYRYFLRRITNPADAAEAYGELLITAWKLHRKMPAEETDARMWLFGVAHNVLRSTRRSSARHSSAVRRFADELRTTAAFPADDKGAELRDAIASLSAADAELIRLIYWDGFKSHEAAVIVGVKPSTLRSRMTSIKAQLRTLLSPAPTEPVNPAHIPCLSAR
ncbi:RNA polymerase sigma factor [Salinibacterium sp. NK8237]|uniref:RNA polymerase sigma factor n=1 Tax=Salinibacterium sp. NK8237 TaxID=2792038 RepID=UPI0018CC8DA5|nr:sigma-70 family RNA polymerase sigma factor [Salinibacterium sp. NK8237]MBH0130232.1 sigma-70 family RNA polymerase sigma factor [Salinibacterium sp. NK8237]